jgi:alkylation response protein AidB-like acyl-CoA dehydrogenase
VDFDLSPDQTALREGAAALLDRYAARDEVRRFVGGGVVVGTLPGAGGEAPARRPVPGGPPGDAPCGYDPALWAAMADQGWLSVEVPEADGGLGLGMVEVAVLAEQLGRYVAPAPFLSTVLALGALRDALDAAADAGAESSDREVLAGHAGALGSGDAVACVVWDARDRPAGARQGGPEVTATRDDGGSWTLTGTTAPVLDAPSADVAVVGASGSLFCVTVTDAVRPVPLPAMDRTRELGRFEFAGTPALHIGGPDAATRLLDRAATGMAAELLGAADRVLEMSVAYAKDRVQFGKPIGSFQAIKHRLADALVDVEGMRSTLYYAAWCNATGDADASLAASMAKAWCTDASRRVISSGLQVHGGIGFTWEHDLHLFLKRAQLDQVSFGDAAYHRDRIAGILRARLDVGTAIF